MAAPKPEEIALIRQFEPILFFAPGERFFPSDAKRYVERCSLWDAKDPSPPDPKNPFATADTWSQVIPADTIVVAADGIGSGDTFLGSGFLTPPSGGERFLSLFGWRDPDDTVPSPNFYANVESIAQTYEHGTLKDSRFWYHAEFFSTDRLKLLFATVLAAGGLDFSALLKPAENKPPVLRNPALICYYLFFPAHEEGLPDCNNVPQAQLFGNYAGDWACVALVLDRPTLTLPYRPQYIGLTNRNIGVVKQPDGSEVRVGMRVLPWEAVLATGLDHPRLSVAKGSHAIYHKGEVPEPVAPFTVDDFARNSCGLLQEGASLPMLPPAGAGADLASLGIGWLKTVDLGGLANALFPWAGGIAGGLAMVAGYLWSIAEVQPPPLPQPVPPPLPPAPGPITDTVATGGNGLVIHPHGVLPTGVNPANAIEWPTAGHTSPTNGRKYDPYVDRDATVMWPDDPLFPGFKGRWGPRVENDPSLRRSGMLFPSFWRMCFDALVRSDPLGAAPVQVLIDASEGTPIGNATNNAGLAAAYDGDLGKTWENSPTGDSPDGVYIGKHFPTAYRISGIWIWLSSDLGFNSGNDPTAARRNFTIYGKNGADPADPRDGDTLYVSHDHQDVLPDGLLPDIAGFFVAILAGFDTTGTHDRVWVTLDNEQGDGLSVFTQVGWVKTI